MTTRIELIRPDDWHLHLRDGELLSVVAPISGKIFGRAIIMPNLVPPVVTVENAAAYRDRIMASLPVGSRFQPLMTLYLTQDTQINEIKRAAASGFIKAVKLYPAGATTNSASGVTNFDAILPVLEKMAELNLPLCVHGEVTDQQVDIFDREAVFIENVLDPIRQKIPALKVVLEHITTAQGVDYVVQGGIKIAGTITTHHLIINRNHLLAGAIRPHYYCLPVAKRESHRKALVAAATSGNGRFFLGTDSAPHLDDTKLNACGCAGIFSALNTMSCLAHVFEDAGKLNQLEAFTSRNGPDFYQLPVNQEKVILMKREAPVNFPKNLVTPSGPVTIFDPGFAQYWDIAEKFN